MAWPLLAAIIALLVTPLGLVAIISGELSNAVVCLLVLVPFYYILLSAYLGRLLERHFRLSASDKARLLADMPMHSGTIWLYGRNRRLLLERLLDQQGTAVRDDQSKYRDLVVFHRALELAFILEGILLVAVLLVEQLLK